jgi:hypothetical protein
MLVRLWLCAALVVGLGGAKLLDGGPFVVSYDHMTDAEARDVFERAHDGYAAVTRYLGLTPAQKIIIKDVAADATSLGSTMILTLEGKSQAIRPIQIEIPLRYLRGKPFKTAIVHELTHAVAGVPFQHNLFLAEGLAVHAHGVLARPDEADSFAKYRIHEVARRHLRQVAVLNPIQHIFESRDIFADKERAFASGYTSSLAYVFAGSFVTFLIQKDGPAREVEAVARFLGVYRDGDFLRAYGQPLGTLERQWISYVNTMPVARSTAAP